MQVKVESYECKEKAMTVTFNKICNQENTCYLGQDADVEGYMTYYGMVDEYGLDDSATAYVDLSITLATSSKTLYSQNVFQLEQFYLCDSSLQAEQDGDCPGGGRYKFQNQFFLPAVDNQVKDWAYSGFSGTAELIVYMGQDSSSTMLGYCTFELTTATSGIFSKVPNGKTALIGVFSAILVLLLCATLGCCFADRKNIKESVQKVPSATRKAAKATKQAVNKVAQKVTRLNKPSSDFKLMEDATTNEAKKSWQLDWDSKT
eukprot:scaffold26145_cov103-Cylindrotheca_fusiformis.AAC.1